MRALAARRAEHLQRREALPARRRRRGVGRAARDRRAQRRRRAPVLPLADGRHRRAPRRRAGAGPERGALPHAGRRLARRRLRHRRGRPAGLRQRAPARDLRHARPTSSTARRGSSASRPRTASASSASSAARARWASARRSTCASWPASTAGRASTWRRSRRAPGEPTGLVGTIEDVTVEVTARMALAAREAEYRMLAEHSTDFLSRHTRRRHLPLRVARLAGHARLGLRGDARPHAQAAGHGPPRRHGDHRAQLGRGAARGAPAHRRLPRAPPRRLDRVAGDDLPRRARARRRGARDGVRLARHLRAQERRARARPPRAARRAHRPAQPHAVPRPPRPGAAALAPARPRRGRRLPRPRPLQGRQRLARPQGRRPPARRRGHAPELGPAPVGHARALRRRRADAAVRGHRRRRRRARDRPAPARHLRRALPRRRTARPSCRRASASRSRATASRRPRT